MPQGDADDYAVANADDEADAKIRSACQALIAPWGTPRSNADVNADDEADAKNRSVCQALVAP